MPTGTRKPNSQKPFSYVLRTLIAYRGDLETYWPYATTLFDYVKRAMPFNAPGSLSNDDVYSVVAYILSEVGIGPESWL
jgi:hypothetical protein